MDKHARILIIDDDPGTLNAWVQTLDRAGYQVTKVSIGCAVPELLRQYEADLLLVKGVSSESMDVCRRVKDEPETMGCMIALVVDQETADVENQIDCPIEVDDILLLPVPDRQLLSRIRLLLCVKRAQDGRNKAVNQALRMVHSQSEIKLLSDERYRLIAETSTDAFVQLDLRGMLTYSSPAAKQIFGYAPDEFTGSHFSLYFPASELPQVEAALCRVSAGEYINDLELKALNKQGETVFIQVNATPIVLDGQVASIQGMIRDVTERVKMRAAIQDHAVLVQALLNASTQSMILLDLEMNFLGLNQAAAVALGQPLDALMGQSIFDVLPPPIAQFRKTRVEQVIASGQPVRFEDERAGRIFDNYLYPVFDAQGQVSQVAVFAHDMTERRHAEQARAKSEWRLQLALQNSPVMVFSQDRNLRYTWFYNAEPKFCTEQSIGQVYADLLSPGDALRLSEIKRAVLETGIESRRTIQVIQDDRPRFYDFTIVPEKDGRGNVVGVNSVAVDITERVQAEQRSSLMQERILQQNRELVALNRVTMTMSHNGNIENALVRVLDQLLQVMDFDHGAIQILGDPSRPAGHVVSKGFSVPCREQQLFELSAHTLARLARSRQSVLIYDRAEMPPPMAAFLEAESVQAVLSIPLETQEGVVGLLSLFNAQPFMLSEPEVHLLTAVANQIGLSYENMRLADQAAQIEVLTRLEKLRDELIANVSHELRTPLGLIEIAASSLSSQDVTFDDRARGKFIQIIAQETRRLGVLVENLLRSSQIENRQLRLDKRPTDLDKLILQTLDLMRIQSPDYQLVYEPAGQPVLVMVDAYAIEQILLNLLGNAIKYSFNETPITIQVRQDEKQVIVRVQDRGIGIPADELGRVFARFVRGTHKLVQQAGGVGLGLAVCKELVEAHDGHIWVESELGVGTTASFALPGGSGRARAKG